MSFLLSRPPHLLSAAPLSDDAYGADVRQGAIRHGCVLVLPIVTNDAAARMNEKADYQVLPALVTLKLFVISRSHLSVVGL